MIDFPYIERLSPKRPAYLTLLLICLAAIDSVALAYDGSLIGSLNTMKAYKTYFHLNTNTKGLLTASIAIGGAIAVPFAGLISDRLGRKWGMFIAASIQIVGAVLQGTAQNVAMFLIARFILGAGSAIGCVAAPTYVAETTPYQWRAFALGVYYACWSVGTFVASGICYGTSSLTTTWSWRIPSILQSIFSIFGIVVLFFLPESPRWLVFKDRSDECFRILKALYADGNETGDAVAQTVFKEIQDTLAFEKANNQSLRGIMSKKANRRRVYTACSLAPLIVLTGSNLVSYYFGDILTNAGIGDTHTQLKINMVLAAWQLVWGFFGSSVAEKIGRKWLACISLTLSAIFFYLLAGMTAAFGHSSNRSGVYGTVACMFLFQGAYSFGMTPLTVIYPPEVLSYSIRANGMVAYTFTLKLCQIFSSYVWPFAMAAIGWKTYFVNATFGLSGVVFIYFYWVETKGLTLEEIDEKFDGVKHSDVPDLHVLKDTKEGFEVHEQHDVGP